MTTDTDTYATTGPDIAASKEDREKAEALIEIIESLPTISKAEIRDRYYDKFPNAALFDDENTGTGGLEDKFRPAALDLPGFGSEREDCGMDIPHVCPDCGKPIEIGRTCSQSMCPRCGPAWVLKTAPGIVNNIQGAARMMSAELDEAVYKHHGVISPPPETYIDAENPEQACIEMIQDIMAEINFQGVVLYHPWSGKNDEDGDGIAVETVGHDDDGDYGEWKKRLFEDRDWHGDVREELQHRPHFHLIGACPWFPGGDVTRLVNEATGWVIHRITGRNGSPISLGDIEDVARAVVYALSHVAIDTRDDGKGGSRNTYVRGKKGAKYQAADDRDLKEAKAACYKYAHRLLGFDAEEVACRNDVPEEEADHDHGDEDLDHLDDEADGSDGDGSDEPGRIKCRGSLDSIDRADYVRDEEWQEQALHAEEAVEKKDEWEENGGWEGWIEDQSGQARLPTDPPS